MKEIINQSEYFKSKNRYLLICGIIMIIFIMIVSISHTEDGIKITFTLDEIFQFVIAVFFISYWYLGIKGKINQKEIFLEIDNINLTLKYSEKGIRTIKQEDIDKQKTVINKSKITIYNRKEPWNDKIVIYPYYGQKLGAS